ncbi:MAG TPA: hypothetical protein VJX66_24215, partial [Amycolatopsis sp.]|nr:hypothetical protein [Amycolatopsis sp.]
MLALLAAGGGAALAGAVSDRGLIGDLLGALLTADATAAPPTSLLAVRADDGLLVSFSFVNLDVRTGGGNPPRLALTNTAADGLVILGLGPQSLLEQDVFDDGSGPKTPAQAVGALLSGPSRIALRVPAGSPPIPYDLTTLLDLASFPLSVSAFAKGVSTSAPKFAPAAGETAIEAPFRLFLSPPDTALFSAQKNPVTRNGRTELWHARAVPQLPGGGAAQAPGDVPLRAIWSPDIDAPLTQPPWAADPNLG